MIRINLLPTKKRRAFRRGGPSVSIPAGAGQWWLLGMLLGWLAIMGGGYWLLELEEQAATAARAETAAKNKKAEEIRKKIKEDELKAREAQVAQMKEAYEKLKSMRRTPAYVMYELAMILTDADEGGGPDRDEEKYRQLIKADPQSAINERWDPSGLWLGLLKESGGTLSLEGQARDAADLTEFTRRLRASARFGDLSHPDFQRVNQKSEAHDSRHLNWKLDVRVQRWD